MPPFTVEPATVVETGYEQAERIYWARSPWHYDARFHVPRKHVRHVPTFLEPSADQPAE